MSSLPPGMVDVAQLVPDAILDIQYATDDNLTEAPLPGYGHPAAWLRKVWPTCCSMAPDASRGTAIDVGLIHIDGRPVALGTGFDDFGEQAHTRNASGDALAHRLLLRRCMMAAGFEDYRREWWHFDVPALERPLRDAPYPRIGVR